VTVARVIAAIAVLYALSRVPRSWYAAAGDALVMTAVLAFVLGCLGVL
jgi:hypothetical protein